MEKMEEMKRVKEVKEVKEVKKMEEVEKVKEVQNSILKIIAISVCCECKVNIQCTGSKNTNKLLWRGHFALPFINLGV